MWTIKNYMKINKRKTKELVIEFSKTRTNFPTIRIDGTDTQRVTEAKILGITITSNLTWDVHVDEITRKAGKRLFLLLQLKRSGILAEDLLTVYTTVVRPTLEYACTAWSTSLTLGLQSDMERIQRRAMNIIYPNTPYIEVLANAQLTSLKQRRAHLCEHFAFMWTFLSALRCIVLSYTKRYQSKHCVQMWKCDVIATQKINIGCKW